VLANVQVALSTAARVAPVVLGAEVLVQAVALSA